MIQKELEKTIEIISDANVTLKLEYYITKKRTKKGELLTVYL